MRGTTEDVFSFWPEYWGRAMCCVCWGDICILLYDTLKSAACPERYFPGLLVRYKRRYQGLITCRRAWIRPDGFAMRWEGGRDIRWEDATDSSVEAWAFDLFFSCDVVECSEDSAPIVAARVRLVASGGVAGSPRPTLLWYFIRLQAWRNPRN